METGELTQRTFSINIKFTHVIFPKSRYSFSMTSIAAAFVCFSSSVSLEKLLKKNLAINTQTQYRLQNGHIVIEIIRFVLTNSSSSSSSSSSSFHDFNFDG